MDNSCLLVIFTHNPQPNTVYYISIGSYSGPDGDPEEYIRSLWQVYPRFLRDLSLKVELCVFDSLPVGTVELDRHASAVGAEITGANITGGKDCSEKIAVKVEAELKCSKFFSYYKCSDESIALKYHNYIFPFLTKEGGEESLMKGFKGDPAVAIDKIKDVLREFTRKCAAVGSYVVVANYAKSLHKDAANLFYLNDITTKSEKPGSFSGKGEKPGSFSGKGEKPGSFSGRNYIYLDWYGFSFNHRYGASRPNYYLLYAGDATNFMPAITVKGETFGMPKHLKIIADKSDRERGEKILSTGLADIADYAAIPRFMMAGLLKSLVCYGPDDTYMGRTLKFADGEISIVED